MRGVLPGARHGGKEVEASGFLATQDGVDREGSASEMRISAIMIGVTEGPLVKWAMTPIALSNNIIIPCTYGDVHVFSGDLKINKC